jgi:ABC-type transporter Mla subunit MlaD
MAPIQQNLAQFDGHFAQLNAQLNARFNQMNARLDQLDARFNQVNGRLDQLDAHMAALEAQVGAMNDRLDNVEDSSGQIRRLVALVESPFFCLVPSCLNDNAALEPWQRCRKT